MGKAEQRQLPLQEQEGQGGRNRTGSRIFCQRCSVGLARIGREFSFKCFVVLIFSVAIFLSAIFWVLPQRSTQYGFDAREAIKLGATVQAYFRLEKPASLLVPQVAKLEYDIFGEIGVPFTEVAALSIHQAGVSNWTNVVFGVLSNPMNVSINLVSLSVLRSSLIALFLQQSNLTLTTSIFGQPSAFEILKFLGGITVIPEPSASIWQIPQILFNFTLNNSIHEIKENFVELKEQLKLGLHLQPYENVYVQLTNKNGSTRDPPVTVQASVTSDLGYILPQRLMQLAQTVMGSPPAKNLGLDNSIFGKVKEISLSSYLNCTLHATPPAPSPEPSRPPVPAHPPSDSPAPSPDFHPLPPCFNCDASPLSDGNYQHAPSPENRPGRSIPPIPTAAAPPLVDNHPPLSTPNCGSKIPSSHSPPSHSDLTTPTLPPRASTHPPTLGPTLQMPPDLSPLPAVSYGSTGRRNKGNEKGSESSPLSSPSISPFPSYTPLLLFTHQSNCDDMLCCSFRNRSSRHGDVVGCYVRTLDILSSLLAVAIDFTLITPPKPVFQACKYSS